MQRDKLLLQLEALTSQRRKLKIQLNHYLEEWIYDAVFYTKNPEELKKKYAHVIDYIEQNVSLYYKDKIKFQSYKLMLHSLKTERKHIHIKLKVLKQEIQGIRNQLSNIPKLSK